MESRTFRIPLSDGDVAVEVRGRGPGVLLLHGVSANRRGWRRLAPRVERDFTLFLPDLLGRGESDAPAEARYGLADEVARATELLAGLQPSPRLILGHSHGGAIALALSSRVELDGLVLASPVTPWTIRPRVLEALRWRPVRRTLARLFRPVRRPLGHLVLRRVCGKGTPVTATMVRTYTEPYAERGRVETLMRIVADWRPEELEGWLPSRPPPTRVLVGEKDPRVLPRDAEALARRLGAPFQVVPGAGHVLPEEAPAALARALRELHAEAVRR